MVQGIVINPSSDSRLAEVAFRLGWREIDEVGPDFEFAIELLDDRLVLRETRGTKTLTHQVDIDSFLAAQKSFPASRKGVFNQAIGRRTVSVIDATGGWGGDSLLLCSQGYRVLTIERIPLLALFLKDAFAYLGRQAWVGRNNVHVPAVLGGESRDYLARGNISADCIYIDPMFPPKRKASAAVNKTISMLQKICGSDGDAVELLDTALRANVRRVVVKRPLYAKPLGGSPDEQFSGKLVRYDLYMP